MSSLNCRLSKLPGIENFIRDTSSMSSSGSKTPGIDEIITKVVSAKNVIAFSTSEDPFPYLYFIGSNQVLNPSIDVSILDQSLINRPLITALDISSDEEYVVTGYNNGQIILWSTKLRIRVAYFNEIGTSPVNSISFQQDMKSIFVALSNNQVHHLSLMSIMDYLTIKSEDFFPVKTPALQIKSMAFCDCSRVYVALSFENSVRVIVPGNFKKTVLDLNIDNPIISLSNYEWTIYLAISSHNTLYIYSINDNDEYKLINQMEFDAQITNIQFVSSSIISIYFNEEIKLVHINGQILSVMNNLPKTPKLLSTLNDACIILPYIINIEQWKERLDNLQKEGKYQKAISTALEIYNGESIEFECSIDRDDIREYINKLLVSFVKSGTVTQQDMLLIANAAIETESPQQLLRLGLFEMADQSIQHPLIVAMLSAAANRSDLAPSIVRKVIELSDVDSEVLENFLMRITLPPSFTQEVIAFAKRKRFTRFLIHHFDTVYNNIFPIFADVVENGTKEEIATALQYIFLSGEFEPRKSNICIVWLFGQQSTRARKCFESNWSMASQLFKVFISRSPISFSSCQKLTAENITVATAASFDGAPLGSADLLFEILSQHLLNLNIPVPSERLKTFISFIFESNSDKKVREKLFKRIVEKDFKDVVVLNDFQQLCVSAGFSDIVTQYFKDINYESIITTYLLSDQPEDSFNYIESNDLDKERISIAIHHRFNALLLLNPKRFVSILMHNYKDLHPKFIRNLGIPSTIILYYESLFETEDGKLATKEDAYYFIEFLYKNNIVKFVSFVEKPFVLTLDEIYNFCEEKKIYIGCATYLAIKEDFSKSFEYYEKHLNEGGQMCPSISRLLMKNILKIFSATHSKVIRTIINPLVYGSGGENDAEMTREFIDIGCSCIDRHEVLLAVLPLVTCTLDKSRARTTILKFIKSFNCFYVMNKPKDSNLAKTLHRISENSLEEILTSSSLTVIDGGDGVTLLSTLASDGENAKKMPADLFSDVKSAFQGAESIFVEEGNRVSQDIDATIILLIDV
ncbi:hypothetical protein TVAG_605450 [Trichomonas vaginalis G3]|uniref:Vacuolar protein sorting-associated protein 8 central domain-containing protein n=1 Tax=Trichomonas vaginalis (strain ATCC PRA-98 / G3) TaxID=412133 RepID=A2GC19_TRIV3|nr:VPS8 subunit of corvet complex family [Trichomonas vaginalis G3]EAX85297.1 hypothetical protein TVAG_605450 [Trichomonas vaginalis G3]KAI5538846.1 VPS8 subunit of corvet complex family [Trichomonas vaginalis G3]|eukprot:XP_001298227.1 hypothetical protein [Trichomonas vaginalis G3]